MIPAPSVRQTLHAAFFATLLMMTTSARAQAAPEMKIISPEPLTTPLINPGKGWVCYTKPEKATPEEVSLASVGYTRFEWGRIQPDSAHEFNWQPIDDFIAAWAAKGKQSAFGVMTANSHSPVKDGYVTPKWVYDAGVSANMSEIKAGADQMSGTPGIKREPADFNHPKFTEMLEIFLKAFAERYDGDRRIAFIDVRSFGNWGESYNGAHLQLHRKYFKKTRLCQSIQMAEWAEGVAKQGVAVRRDGIGGSLGWETAPAYGHAPGIFEFWGPLAYLKQNNWWDDGRLLEKSIRIGKPTYVELVRASPEFIPENRPLIDSMTNLIGFHFLLREARFPAALQKGVANKAEFTWRNDGIAPIYAPCTTAVALVAPSGEVADISLLSGSTPGKWMPGEPVSEPVTFTFSRARPGTYRLAVGLLYDPADQNPTYLLGIQTARSGNWHLLDSVTVK
jgi:hypothetical protein